MMPHELCDDWMANFERLKQAQDAMRHCMQRDGPKLEDAVMDQILLLMQVFSIDTERLEAAYTLRCGKVRKKARPKYINPDNPAQTWAGRGSMPHWVKAQLESGRSFDELLVTSKNSIIATHF